HLRLLCVAPPPPGTPTLSLHDALPISRPGRVRSDARRRLLAGEGRRHRQEAEPGRGFPLGLDALRIAEGLAEHLEAAAGLGLLRSEEHTSELQSLRHLVCRRLLEKKQT